MSAIDGGTVLVTGASSLLLRRSAIRPRFVRRVFAGVVGRAARKKEIAAA